MTTTTPSTLHAFHGDAASTSDPTQMVSDLEASLNGSRWITMLR